MKKFQNTKDKIQINNNDRNLKFKTDQSLGSFVFWNLLFVTYLFFGICYL